MPLPVSTGLIRTNDPSNSPNVRRKKDADAVINAMNPDRARTVGRRLSIDGAFGSENAMSSEPASNPKHKDNAAI